MQNEDVDYKILASHFGRTKEAMRQLNERHKQGKKSLWKIYVKAYNYDIGLTKMKQDTIQKKIKRKNRQLYN